MKSWVHTTGVR